MRSKKVSIIIPTFRDKEILLTCLSALRQQTYPADLIEILCIDNTPDFELQGSEKELEPARLLHEPHPGSYAARNCGLAEATGDIFAFTDADCWPYRDWIERGVAEVEHHPEGVLVVGGVEVFARDPKRPTPVEVLQINTAFPQERYAKVHNFGATANVFVPRLVIEQAGVFLDTLASGGDQEFGKRVHSKGFPVVYCGAALIRHPARRNMKDLLQKSRRVLKGVYDLELQGRRPKGFFRRGILSDIRPPFGTCWRILKAVDSGPLPSRLGAIGTVVLMGYIRAFLRLKFLLS